MANIKEFSKWISCKLMDLKIDDSDNVYGSYINGILDSDESNDEKIEAIEGLLSGICEQESNYLTTICQEVLDEWSKFSVKDKPSILEEAVIDSTLSQLLESQKLATAKLREPSKALRDVKETILNQYSHMTDDDEEDDCDDTAETQEARLQKNTNAQVVAQAEKDKRQQAKADSQKKKCKDKEDREKQKQLKEERKEKVKRKTQKVERKR